MKYYFWGIISLAFMALIGNSCQSANKNDDKTDESSTAFSAYWRLEGTLGGRALVMNLGRSPFQFNRFDNSFQGNYYFLDEMQPRLFFGENDSLGQIVLTEEIGASVSGQFTGSFSPGLGIFTGVYTGSGSENSLPFEFRALYPQGTVHFETIQFKDSIVLTDSIADSPMAMLSETWLWPDTSVSAEATKFLQKELLKGMLGDSMAALVQSPAQGFDLAKRPYFEQYKTDMAGFEIPKDPNDNIMFSYDQTRAVEILFNQDDILTLGFFQYWFTGGAHGNYATFLVSYDMHKLKAYQLGDIFVDNAGDSLSIALAEAARKHFELMPDAALDEVLFENKIAPTDNFGLTSKGIIFCYPPYEVAPYAAGEIRLFVPFERVKAILKPDFGVAMNKGQTEM